MTDLVDFMFLQEQSFIGKRHTQKHFNTKQIFSNQTISSMVFGIEEQHKNEEITQKYLELDFVWSILLNLNFSQKSLKFTFKLLKNGEIYRVKSHFMKTYFINQFMRQTSFVIKKSINPLTGQINLSVEYFLHERQQNLNLKEELQKFTKMIFFQKIVVEFWQQVINLEKGNFTTQNNISISQKILQAQILGKMSAKQNEAESVYNFKNYVSNQNRKQSGIVKQLKQLLIMQQSKLKQNENIEYKKSLTQIFRQKKKLQQESIRQTTNFSNFQILCLDQKQSQILSKKVFYARTKQVIKVNDQKVGKIFVEQQFLKSESMMKVLQELSSLSNSHEYSFLNHYFRFNSQNGGCFFKMALKKSNLKDFLESNLNCMSFRKKIEILLQMFHILQQIWERFNSFPGFFNIADFSITKSHMIKFQNIEKWVKIDNDQEFRVSDFQRFLYKSEIMVRFERIFAKIFFGVNFIKLQKDVHSTTTKSFLIFSNTNSIREYPSEKFLSQNMYGIKEIFCSIFSCFEMYNHTDFVKLRNENQRQSQQNIGLQEIIELKHQFKKGNLDMVLGVIQKNIQLLNLLNM